ncbi:MAG: phosphoribosyltransferase family protein [Bacillota bacterium]
MDAILRDRHQAGQQLAERCAGYRNTRPLILAVPRGGVVVGAALAAALGGDLDVVVARKIGAPHNPEFAIAAVTETGTLILEDRLVSYLNISQEYIQRQATAQRQEIERRTRHYRQGRPRLSAAGRITIVVDDGIATGLTMLAALKSVSGENPTRLLLAVPVAPPDVAATLRQHVDELVCLHTPEPFYAVGQWYRHFDQTPDAEVVALLEAHISTPGEPD